MAVIFYARVSTEQQNEARQMVMAQEANADKVFLDKVSGRSTSNREQLKAMLDYVREGDTLIVESISRLARNTKDFLNIIDALAAKGVIFKSLKEDINTDTPTGKFMLTVFSALAALEVDTIAQRRQEGIEIAKAQGKYKGRKPMSIDLQAFTKACKEWREGKRTAVSVQKAFGITGTTFYKKVHEYNL